MNHGSVLYASNEDVISCVHEYTFDVCQLDIWMALSFGGTVVMLSKEMLLSVDGFCTEFAKARATHLSLTPSYFSILVGDRTRGHRLVESLQCLMLAGEALDHDAITAWMREDLPADNPVMVTNMFGPTEITIACTNERVKSNGTTNKSAASNIGFPLPLYKAYVVNRYGIFPSPTCTRKTVDSRGYIKRPDLNNEKLIVDPFDPIPVGRVYKRGDLCSWNSDGSLDFHGRIDHQVKLRGFRIELGEIESVIRGVDGVKQSVVCVQSPEESAHLVGYVVPGDVDTELVLSACRSHLPPYMVPTGIVAMDAFPLSRNGKVDRKALPRLEHRVTTASGRPENMLQSRIRAAFAQALAMDEDSIGVDDSFHDLGGSSLSLMKMLDLSMIGVNLHAVWQLERLSVSAIYDLIMNDRASKMTSEETIPTRFGQLRLWKPSGEEAESEKLVFCFPAIDGSSDWTRFLHDHLRHSRCVLEFDERIGQESFMLLTSYLASEVARIVEETRCAEFSFIGYSFGTGLAYGVSRALDGLQPTRVMHHHPLRENKSALAAWTILEDFKAEVIVHDEDAKMPTFLLVKAKTACGDLGVEIRLDYGMSQLVPCFEQRVVHGDHGNLIMRSSREILQCFHKSM